ncbi:CLUMA_CG010468, isoform A [Clunio marinus]|uniref:CLUMA_CG010468, isoform A n=1 Tax=Clunio marinus TaxID=568069 RepID=A0A1J1IA05_9DIPT|nr:CLUMA_CG010468, isoform A [Clunio marinus]
MKLNANVLNECPAEGRLLELLVKDSSSLTQMIKGLMIASENSKCVRKTSKAVNERSFRLVKFAVLSTSTPHMKIKAAEWKGEVEKGVNVTANQPSQQNENFPSFQHSNGP